MKARRIYLSVLLLTGFIMMAAAQPGPGRGEGRHWSHDGPGFKERHMNLPDLSDEQKEKIAELRTSKLKVMLEKRNQVHEKMARLQSLQTADKADIKAINAMIDEISEIKTDMAKQRAAHRQKIRELLTDKQRVIFDNKAHGSHHGDFGKGHPGRGRGRADCPCAE